MILNDRTKVATILAALRFYQENGQGDPDNRSDAIHDIATGGEDEIMSSLDDAGIDELCEEINCAPKEPHIVIHDEAWQLTGSDPDEGVEADPGEHPASRLLTAINVNDTWMHLEAFEVKQADPGHGVYAGGEQIAADPTFEDDVEKLQNMQDTSFVTTEIMGRTYILVATPNGD